MRRTMVDVGTWLPEAEVGKLYSIPSSACATILPITRHDRPIVARLIGHEQFLQRCKDPTLAKGIGAEVTEKLIVVIQHVQLKTGATGGAEGHPPSLPDLQLRDLHQHGFPARKVKAPRDQLGQPAG